MTEAARIDPAPELPVLEALAQLLAPSGRMTIPDQAAARELEGDDRGPAGDQDAAIEALAALVADTHLRRERWQLALQADRRNDPAACLEDCLAILELAPHDREARVFGARAARELRSWEQSARLFAGLLEGNEPPGGLDWERIVVATVAGDAAGVADSVERLGLDEAAWGSPESVVFVVLDGRPHTAQRSGPATAIITAIAPDGRPQHAGDVVAFDPQPITAATSGDGPDGWGGHTPDLPQWPAFRALAILEPGRRQVWTAHGADPGFDVWEDAVADLAADGWIMRRASPGTDDHDCLGVVSVPADVEPGEVERRIRSTTAAWSTKVHWTC